MVKQGVVLLALWAAPAWAQAPAAAVDSAAAFGAREAVQQIILSPDGTRVAFVAPDRLRGSALYITSVAEGAKPLRTLVATGAPEHLGGCEWVANDRLVCNVYSLDTIAGSVTGASRMIGVNADGTDVKPVGRRQSDRQIATSNFGGQVIDWKPGIDGSVLMTRVHIPKVKSDVNVFGGSIDGLGVDLVDTRGGTTKELLGPVKAAVEFISDGQGTVRVMGSIGADSDGRSIAYSYRPKGTKNWQGLGRYNRLSREGFNPFAVDAATDVVYGFRKANGRQALFRRALSEGAAEELVFAHPQVDIDGLLRLGRSQRVIGVSYVTTKRQAHYFDPAIGRVAASLAKALPATPLIGIEGASDDETKLLVWAGSDADAGRYYVYDRTAKQLKPLLLSRPEVASVKLATVKPVEVRTADGTNVPGYLTLPPGSTGKGLPAIVMPHGGPGARDEWRFDWLAQYYANRGFAVLQPNFRGSSGYGDEWFKNNGFQSWRIAIGDVTDSGRWLVSQGIADPAKLAVVGWSYGGYAALQSGVVAPDLFKAIVAIAPVTDLGLLKSELRAFSGSAIARDYVGAGAHIREGSPAQRAAEIRAPVQLFHGELDQNVDVAETRFMAGKLRAAGKPVDVHLYPGLQHNLSDSGVRAEMLRKSDAFLRASMGM